MRTKACVIVPNWNGYEFIADCLAALEKQTVAVDIIVVDNGSVDQSVDFIRTKFPNVTILEQPGNLGFAGGVNIGIRHAIKQGRDFILLLNNDAQADKDWAKRLIQAMDNDSTLGISASKIVSMSGPAKLDSTGEQFSTWGLAFPRGRDEIDLDKYDSIDSEIFGASGGASIYRAEMLKQVGLFDEDFFAYYEDIDLSFRARLAGWYVRYVPEAIVKHHIGGTSNKMTGFTTYHALKNQPWILIKNLPMSLWLMVWPRFILAYSFFFLAAIAKGKGWPALKGLLVSILFLPKKLYQRHEIQKNKKLSTRKLKVLFYHGLPRNYTNLYKLVYFYKR